MYSNMDYGDYPSSFKKDPDPNWVDVIATIILVLAVLGMIWWIFGGVG